MPSPILRQRQIHLDFHTGPAIPDVGADFNAREFARTMKRAHVNSVTVFAKCHHGHLYYNTRRPERHPSLKRGLDLTRGQVDGLHREDIRAPIYISVQCDEYAANTHPDWVARNPNSSQVKWGGDVFKPGWQILDMSSPYQEFLAGQVEEILGKFKPVDGIFFDMCWDQPSTTHWAIDGMLRADLNPQSEADRAVYARQVARAYMKRFYALVKQSAPQATVYFNSRPLHALPDDIAALTHVEIEALPTGGWGYMYFPKHVRYARNFGKPYMGMTARFHKSWGDFAGLKPAAALKYEVSQMLAHGAECSIGDQLHPRGRPDRAAYELIGSVYGYAAQCEPWTQGARPVTQVGVFRAAGAGYHDAPGGPNDGVTRMFTQLKLQFDVVDGTSALENYDLLVVPDEATLDAALEKRLRACLKKGGRLLIAGSLKTVLPEMGLKVLGDSPYTTTYIRFGKAISAGVAAADHVMYERGVRVRAATGAQILAKVVEPYFERTWDHFCSHNQTPNQPQPSRYPAAVRKGNVITIPYPIFKAFGTHGNLPYRSLVKNCIDLLLPDKLLEITGPSTLEATVMRQKQRTIVHLLNFVAERRTQALDIVEDIIPIYNIPLKLRLAKKPGRACLAPTLEQIPFTWASGTLTTVIPQLNGHGMLVLE